MVNNGKFARDTDNVACWLQNCVGINKHKSRLSPLPPSNRGKARKENEKENSPNPKTEHPILVTTSKQNHTPRLFNIDSFLIILHCFLDNLIPDTSILLHNLRPILCISLLHLPFPPLDNLLLLLLLLVPSPLPLCLGGPSHSPHSCPSGLFLLLTVLLPRIASPRETTRPTARQGQRQGCPNCPLGRVLP